MRRLVDTVLHRLNLDVGHAFAVLLLYTSVEQLYSVVFSLLTFPTFQSLFADAKGWLTLIFLLQVAAFLVAGTLGLGMLAHVDLARKCLIALVWLGIGFGVFVFLAVAIQGDARQALAGGTIVGARPVVTWYLLPVLLAPIPWLVLAMLHSSKARREFGVRT